MKSFQFAGLLVIILSGVFKSNNGETLLNNRTIIFKDTYENTQVHRTDSGTKVVLIGTGNPGIDPQRSGPATAIIVNGKAYIVDMGPGIVRRAKLASIVNKIPALDPVQLKVVFVTHLHSDHTVGYPDLIFTPWTIGRRFPLEVYGPSGIIAMTENILKAYQVDIDTRTNEHGMQRDFPDGHKVNAHEVKAGVVYQDSNITVTAFVTKHAMESYGYRFDTKDRSIVISGDTNPTEATISACNSCDVLIHEAIPPKGHAGRSAAMQEFAAKYHTTTSQLIELAQRAKPKLLIIHHIGLTSYDAIVNDMKSHYPGKFVMGRDLDVY